jgi:hypothetical protein
MKEAASAMKLLRQEGDSGSKKVIVKLDFDEGSPNGAMRAQSNKQPNGCNWQAETQENNGD